MLGTSNSERIASCRNYVGHVVDIALITGLSGAGRSAAANVLDDLGWYVIDNLPTTLIDPFIDLASKQGSELTKLALVAGRQHQELPSKLSHLRSAGHRVTVVFRDGDQNRVARVIVVDQQQGWFVDELESCDS